MDTSLLHLESKIPAKNKKFFPFPHILVGIGILVYIGLNIALFRFGKYLGMQKKIQKNTAQQNVSLAVNTPFPTPTPRPLPKGKQVYQVSSKDAKGPLIRQVSIDPIDDTPGQNQAVEVTLVGPTNTSSVKATILGDNGTTDTHALASTSIDATIWKGSWNSLLSHNYTYQLIIEATDQKGTTAITLSFR